MPETHSFIPWDAARDRALKRDGNVCTVSRLLRGPCSPGPLHVHHIVPRDEGGTDDLDNLGTTCAHHHPMWEALRRQLVRNLLDLDRRTAACPHQHRTREAREICERRRARQLGRLLVRAA